MPVYCSKELYAFKGEVVKAVAKTKKGVYLIEKPVMLRDNEGCVEVPAETETLKIISVTGFHKHNVSATVSTLTYRLLHEEASRKKTSLSQVIRDILHEWASRKLYERWNNARDKG